MPTRRIKASRKRVLFMPHHFRQPKDQGGLRSWHIVNQLKEFTDIIVIVPGVDTLSGQRVKGLGWRLWVEEQLDDRVRIIWVNALPNIRTSKLGRALYYLSFSAVQFLRGIFMRRVDVVLTTSMPVSTMFLAWVTACRHRARLVLDVRDLPTDLAIELGYFRDGTFSRSLQRLEHFVLRRADQIVTVSSGMAEVLGSHLGSDRKVFVVPIGFDALEGSGPAEKGVWDHLPLENRFVVLYSGTMGFVVDVDTVLEAARMTRDRREILYLFVGDGQRLEEYRQKSRDDQSNCLFIGRIPKHAIARVCEQAHACVYPLVDGRIIGTLLGNKIFDYMGAGKPTLFTGPVGDVSRLIEDAGAGVCLPAGAADLLAEKIVGLSEDRARCERMGQAARRFVMDGWTARETTGRMAKLIAGMIQ